MGRYTSSSSPTTSLSKSLTITFFCWRLALGQTGQGVVLGHSCKGVGATAVGSAVSLTMIISLGSATSEFVTTGCLASSTEVSSTTQGLSGETSMLSSMGIDTGFACSSGSGVLEKHPINNTALTNPNKIPLTTLQPYTVNTVPLIFLPLPLCHLPPYGSASLRASLFLQD